MSIHTPLSRAEVVDLLTLYDLGALVELRPARGSSAHTNYLLTTDRGRHLLRVHEGRSFRELVYEKELLLFLQANPLAVATPHSLANVIGGHFTPVAEGVYSSIYSFVDGRAVATWEVDAALCAQVGALLAELHRVGQGFRGHRRHPDRPARLFASLDALTPSDPAMERWLRLAQRQRRQLQRPLARRVPHTLTHGELTPDNVKLRRGRIAGLIDFETASRGPALLDLGVALNAWCWGGAGALDGPRCQALIAAYLQQQPLRPRERRLLFEWTRFAALRGAVRRASRHERGAGHDPAPAYYRDYRHDADRLAWLAELEHRDFDRLAGL